MCNNFKIKCLLHKLPLYRAAGKDGILVEHIFYAYNCRGFKSSMPDVQKLINDYQIIFLQETWLAGKTTT